VFVAPLIRPHRYNAARFGRAISRPFVDRVETRDGERFGLPTMPLSWFDALVAWNREIESIDDDAPIIDRAVLIVQGEEDDVVAWRYNVQFLRERVSEATVDTVPGLPHVLSARSDAARETVSMIMRYLQEGE
jgi:lysophospholipase